MVEKELGAPIDELFSEFSAKPIAAASLAQVRASRGCRQGRSRAPAACVGLVHGAAPAGPYPSAVVLPHIDAVPHLCLLHVAATPRVFTCRSSEGFDVGFALLLLYNRSTLRASAPLASLSLSRCSGLAPCPRSARTCTSCAGAWVCMSSW